MEVIPAPVDTRSDMRARARGDDGNDGVFGAMLDTGRERSRTAKAPSDDEPKAGDRPSEAAGETGTPFGMTEGSSGTAQVADRLLAALVDPGGQESEEIGGQQTANALGLPAGPPPQSAPPPPSQPSNVPANVPAIAPADVPAAQPAPASSSIEAGAKAGLALPDGKPLETPTAAHAASKFGDRIEVRTERMPEVSRPSQDLVRNGPPARPDAVAPTGPAKPTAEMSSASSVSAATAPTGNDRRAETGRPADTLQALAPGAGKTEQVAIPETTSIARPHPATAAVREQIVVQIVRAAGEGLDRIGIQLNPPTLGRVDVRLDMAGDGRVVATVTADNQSTLDLMQRDARGLERALNDAGLKADAGGLSFSLRDGGGSDGRNGQGAGSTHRAEAEPAKDQAIETPQSRQSRHDGALDMSV